MYTFSNFLNLAHLLFTQPQPILHKIEFLFPLRKSRYRLPFNEQKRVKPTECSMWTLRVQHVNTANAACKHCECSRPSALQCVRCQTPTRHRRWHSQKTRWPSLSWPCVRKWVNTLVQWLGSDCMRSFDHLSVGSATAVRPVAKFPPVSRCFDVFHWFPCFN